MEIAFLLSLTYVNFVTTTVPGPYYQLCALIAFQTH
jgi:hypothetical protein